MDRLTAKDEQGNYYYPECFEKCCGEGHSEKCSVCELDKNACNTLGAYEDTDLTPAEIVKLVEVTTNMLDKVKRIVELTQKFNNLHPSQFGDNFTNFLIERDEIKKELIAACTYLTYDVLSKEAAEAALKERENK